MCGRSVQLECVTGVCSAQRLIDRYGWTMRMLIYPSAPVHATLAQPAAGADALKDLRARRSEFF